MKFDQLLTQINERNLLNCMISAIKCKILCLDFPPLDVREIREPLAKVSYDPLDTLSI